MRIILLLALLPYPVSAWEFTPDPICTLTHSTADVDLTLTHDPDIPLYSLSLRRKRGAWDKSDTFGMAFRGDLPIDIGTRRHQITGDVLSVADSGFGNVLNGLQFNKRAFAFTEAHQIDLRLDDAAPAVEAFRRCPANLPATS